MKNLILLTIIGLFLTSAILPKKVDTRTKFVQGDRIMTVDQPVNEVRLEKEPFKIQFFVKQYDSKEQKFHSGQISAFLERKTYASTRVGDKVADVACFIPGTGMAPSVSGEYEHLYLNNSGHHYFYYENDDKKRGTVIGKEGDLIQLEFEISSIHHQKNSYTIENTPVEDFYILILRDYNKNGVIDKGELDRVKIVFTD